MAFLAGHRGPGEHRRGLVLAATAAGHRTEAAFHPINPTSKPARLLQPTTLNAM
jgi:hypothetical protein